MYRSNNYLKFGTTIDNCSLAIILLQSPLRYLPLIFSKAPTIALKTFNGLPKSHPYLSARALTRDAHLEFSSIHSSANSSCRLSDYKLCKFVKMEHIIDDKHNLLASGLEQSVWLESETNVIDVFSPIQASNVHLCHVCVKKFVQSLHIACHCLLLSYITWYY